MRPCDADEEDAGLGDRVPASAAPEEGSEDFFRGDNSVSVAAASR